MPSSNPIYSPIKFYINMTKEEIARALSDKTNLDVFDSTKLIDIILGIMGNAMCEGRNIYIRGFGTFQIVTRQGHAAYDFQKKKPIITEPITTVKFKPSKMLIIKKP